MRRLAIVEYVMSAGGLERVLRGLAGAFLEIPEARNWDITFLLARFNSAHHRCEWPAGLAGPNLRVEWLGEESAASRFVDPLARGQGLWGLPLSKPGGFVLAQWARSAGPEPWRAWLGDPRALIARASARFDLLCFPYPVALGVPNVVVPIVTTPQDFNFRHFLPESSPHSRVDSTRRDRLQMVDWSSASKSVQSSAVTTSERSPTMYGTQLENRSHTWMLALLSSRSTCLTACLPLSHSATASALPMA